MSEVRKVSIALTEEQIEALKAVVATGEYATTSELRQRDIERLRQLWDEGKASGPPKPFDIERTIAAAKARLKNSAD
jgi:antitoxin ParD1/3/4